MSRIALRMDDVGASSKQYEIYSKRWFGIGNFLFLKYLPYFRAWGPYRELSATEWYSIINTLKEHNAKLTVAVTAAWVDGHGVLIPYDKKWPEAYKALKTGVDIGVIEIACHGLTHCVLQNMSFLPKAFTSNRRFHREFWDWLPPHTHENHLYIAKKILDEIFETEVTTLVPPGNVFSDATIEAANKVGFRVINCMTKNRNINNIRIIDNENIVAFHDREIILYGVGWLIAVLKKYESMTFVAVKDI